MRAIAGALLIVAASILVGAAIIVSGNHNQRPEGGAYMGAAILGLIGLVLILTGLGKDRLQ
ncbi:MAG: hypothetical protein L0Y71_02950 [Gemmataceae bacterium]|nr:hypothetical protein [Gemmataceae bacterium]